MSRDGAPRPAEAVAAVWCSTATGWKAGTRRPGSSSAASRAPVATSTARQGIWPCSAVLTPVVETAVTCTDVRTVPGGREAASSSGTAAAPPAGSHNRPWA